MATIQTIDNERSHVVRAKLNLNFEALNAELVATTALAEAGGGGGGGGTGDMLKSQNLSGLANVSTARTNLGLGGAAVLNVGTTAGTVSAGDHTHSTFAATSHTHSTAQVTGLDAALAGKQASGSYSVTGHGHAIADTTGLQAALDGKQVSGSYAATSHAHAASEVTSGTLSPDRLAAGTALQVFRRNNTNNAIECATISVGGGDMSNVDNLSGLASASTARTNLGLGGAAILNVGTTAGTVSAGDHTHSGYAATSHAHAIADTTGLQTALDGKQASGSYAAASHSHATSDVTGLDAALTGKAASSHTHATSDVTGLDTALSGKAPTSHAHPGDALTPASLAAVGTVTGSNLSGTNTGDNATNSLYSGLVTNATHTGDATGDTALTLATVNANVGSFGSATAAGTFTVNAKGLVTAAGSTTVTPAVGSISGLGTGVGTALAVAVGSAGAPVVNGGALGTPSSGTLTSCTIKVELGFACSDESTAITAGTNKLKFRMPFAMTLTAVRASVTTAPTGAALVIDINEGGTTILSTKLSIDASELTSTTAATAAVISDTALADDAEMSVDFDQVGSTVAGTGVKVWLIGTRT